MRVSKILSPSPGVASVGRPGRLPAAGMVLIPILAILLFSLAACTTPEAAPEPKAAPPVEPAEVPPPAEPEPLGIDWADTAWIIPDPPDQRPKEFPGYRGFHLAGDGRLRLINIDMAVGDHWEADGNRLTLTVGEGRPNLPLEGTLLVFPGTSRGSTTPIDPRNISSIRLVPESQPGSEGLVLERAGVNVDIVENHWIPKELAGGDTVMWPMNREIHLMLLPDAVGGMGILGYGGENRFRGSVELGEREFLVGPMAATRRIGPASEFENLYMRRIAEADSYVQVGDDLFLYRGSRPVAAFRVRLFD